MKIPPFLKQDKEKLLFDLKDKTLIYYIPESYFESNLATIVGEYITVMGIFDYTIEDNKTKKNSGIKNFYFPSLFVTKPCSIEKEKGLQLTKYTDPMDYRLLRFNSGDEAVSSTKVPKTVANAELFFNMFIYSRIPNTVPYNKLHNYFIDNIHLNGGDYGISIQLLGAMIREACRDKKNLQKRFSNTEMKSQYDYKLVPLLNLPKLIAPFNAIISENWDDSVINAIQNKNTAYSPLEKLLML